MNTNPNAKRILFYGDSFVFGKIPAGERYDSATRFTGVVQNELGSEYEIIEEGLRGRTVSGENAFFPERDGLMQFGPIYGSHLPVDILVIFLGTNDVNSGSEKSPREIAGTFRAYKEKISWWSNHLGFKEPKVLLIAPPLIEEENSYALFKDIFKGAKAKSLGLPEAYMNIAGELGWGYFESGTVVTPSESDGIHLTKEANQELGEALSREIKTYEL